MPTIDESIARVREGREARGWSRNKLATMAGVPESTIRGIDNPSWNPTADTLRKLEAVIDAPSPASEAA